MQVTALRRGTANCLQTRCSDLRCVVGIHAEARRAKIRSATAAGLARLACYRGTP